MVWWLRLLGFRVLLFLDDWLVLDHFRLEILRDVDVFLCLTSELVFLIILEESSLVPS